MRITQERADELRRKAELSGVGQWYEPDGEWSQTVIEDDAYYISAANPATMLDLLADRDELLAEVATLRSAMRLIAGQIVVHNEKLADAPMSASEHLGEALDVALRFAPGDSPGASEIRSEEWTTKQMLVAEVERLRAKCEERKAVLLDELKIREGECTFCLRKVWAGEEHKPDCAWKRAMED